MCRHLLSFSASFGPWRTPLSSWSMSTWVPVMLHIATKMGVSPFRRISRHRGKKPLPSSTLVSCHQSTTIRGSNLCIPDFLANEILNGDTRMLLRQWTANEPLKKSWGWAVVWAQRLSTRLMIRRSWVWIPLGSGLFSSFSTLLKSLWSFSHL